MDYEDQFCCEFLECLLKDEIVDTYGGDFTYADVYKCDKHDNYFVSYHGCGRFSGIEQISKSDYETYYK